MRQDIRIACLVSAAGLLASIVCSGSNGQPASTRREAGAAVFTAQCVMCHSAAAGDGGGGQGPSLAGIAGRAAATTDGGFAYSDALRRSGLRWDAGALDRFLKAPGEVVPGTAMMVAAEADDDRAALVAYLLSTKAATAPVSAGTGPATSGGWRDDAPGTHHRIDPQDLPSPQAEQSVRNISQVVPRPKGAMPQVMPGFAIAPYTDGLTGPRTIRIAPNGDIFVAETPAGRIRLLRPGKDGGAPERMEIFAQGLDRPFGIAFYPEADPQWVYVGDGNAIKRFPYRQGDVRARGPAETVVPQLGGTATGHWSRDIVFSADGRRMLVSVGSQTNVAEGLLPSRSAEENKAWEQVHGMGAAWGPETDRAVVLSFAPDGSDRRNYATGIRNCTGLSRSPQGDIFCSVNERDALGHDLVPDYLTRVQPGHFYGWPWFYMGANEDPRHAGSRPDLRARVTVPDLLFRAHSAAIHTTFYPASLTGKSAFPAEYRGDAFVTLHGSWNRSPRTGYKVVRAILKDGVPTGEYQDFVTGFVVDDSHVWARPYGIAVLRDGSLLFGDNENNMIWRVTWIG